MFAAIKDAESICDYILNKGHYERLVKIETSINEAIVDGSYKENAISKDELRMILRNGYQEVDPKEMTTLVDDWSNQKEVEPKIYYTFDGEKIVCADNTSNDMFMEEFNKEDYLLAFLWMAKGMAMDEVMILKFHDSKDVVAVK